jgi:hypothetical protein
MSFLWTVTRSNFLPETRSSSSPENSKPSFRPICGGGGQDLLLQGLIGLKASQEGLELIERHGSAVGRNSLPEAQSQ